MTTHQGFTIIPTATEGPDRQWKLEGAINPADSRAGELFESQNKYPSKQAAEQHFIDFAKRYIDGTVTRADIDQNQ